MSILNGGYSPLEQQLDQPRLKRSLIEEASEVTLFVTKWAIRVGYNSIINVK